jgi:hypothetical protein
MAWGPPAFFDTPGQITIWGREFELLPAGTMLTAQGRLSGLIGLPAERSGPGGGCVDPGAVLLLFGVRSTPTSALRPYQDQLAEEFRIKSTAIS